MLKIFDKKKEKKISLLFTDDLCSILSRWQNSPEISYAEELSNFSTLHVRVSLKGTCEEEFSRLTGAIPQGFQLQLKALEYLDTYGVNVNPACMISFSQPESIIALKKIKGDKSGI
ncbi:MAG: hypothetical protein Q8P40_01530 [Nitrospirota bacterium]|nr:hypothetical protein [Nitrospirota bacterium]